MNGTIIGIDLGTTNCTLAYGREESAGEGEITQFEIPQLGLKGAEEAADRLPSFLYFPLEGEGGSLCAGLYARERGAEVPHRMVASAKSWLCHPGVNRRQRILPIGEYEGESLASPVEACAHLLGHLKEAWEKQNPDAPFGAQTVLVTVPASFDPDARELVQEAAKEAGYPEVILLEEPQAAFYAWLHRHREEWREKLKVGDTILVVDVGGGTTDFSLIRVLDEDGDLALERVAVGQHLLLGGDNMDLALAYVARAKLEEQGHDLDDWQFKGLIHSCRSAKEKLLDEANDDQEVGITVLGRGRRLVGGQVTTQLSRDEVRAVVVEGFLPLVEAHDHPVKGQQAGLQTVGLPYAKDGRITSQLAAFLAQKGEGGDFDPARFVVPSVVLFNGGTLRPPILRERLMAQLNQWATALDREEVRELEGADLDRAVSRGAVTYGMARQGGAIRIRGGISRSYFIGVEEALPAVPGMARPLKAYCVAPFGMEEGTECSLEGHEFSLVLGELASFRFFSHSTAELPDGSQAIMGSQLRHWKRDLTELQAVETLLEQHEEDGKTVRVKLHSKVTELGVLELWCAAADGRRWKLEYNVRG